MTEVVGKVVPAGGSMVSRKLVAGLLPLFCAPFAPALGPLTMGS